MPLTGRVGVAMFDPRDPKYQCRWNKSGAHQFRHVKRRDQFQFQSLVLYCRACGFTTSVKPESMATYYRALDGEG